MAEQSIFDLLWEHNHLLSASVQTRVEILHIWFLHTGIHPDKCTPSEYYDLLLKSGYSDEELLALANHAVQTYFHAFQP